MPNMKTLVGSRGLGAAHYLRGMQRLQSQATRGLAAQTVPQSNPGTICARRLDDSVTVGGANGLPLNPLLSSSPLNAQGSLLNCPSDFAFVYSLPAASGSNTKLFWAICGRDSGGNPVSGQSVKIQRPDGTFFYGTGNLQSGSAAAVSSNNGSTTLGTFTGTAPNYVPTNVFNTGASGSTAYVVIYFQLGIGLSGLPTTGIWKCSFQTIPPSVDQIVSASQDYTIALIASYTGSSQIGNTGSGGSGSFHGGGRPSPPGFGP